jgi:hypothetical protein
VQLAHFLEPLPRTKVHVMVETVGIGHCPYAFALQVWASPLRWKSNGGTRRALRWQRPFDAWIIQEQAQSLRIAQGKRNGGQLRAQRYACSVGWRWEVEEPRPRERGLSWFSIGHSG